MLKSLALSLLLATTALAQLGPNGGTASFKGSLPPKPTADLSADQQAAVEKRLAEVTTVFQAVKKHPRAADADIFIKAVRFALEFHEWYDKKAEDGLKKANALLDEAAKRIESLKENKTPWMEGFGVKVLGFYSAIDDSPQPYGVEIPEGLEWGASKKTVPMWVWLHGRGDTSTDLHFIASQMKSKGGQFKPAGTIIVHPFGRYCNGFKSAGETDVMECKADATQRFNIDVNRIALAGFSMGGAGAWHLGAHYADQWACVHTGAGFVDVKRYTKVTPETMPPWYEQKLWGVYDVPDYARNFLNVPLISYSGEVDGQRDGAEYMTEVLKAEGMTRPHLIGPGMGHKYHPETIKEVQRLIEEAVAKGRDPWPKQVHLQSRSLRYDRMFWVRILEFGTEWEDARIDAEIIDADKSIRMVTKNVAMLYIDRAPGTETYKVFIDGVEAEGNGVRGYANRAPIGVGASNGTWASAGRGERDGGGWHMIKSGPADCGPIDFAFLHEFIVVLPDHLGSNPAVDSWVKAESARFIQRWRGLMRGDPRVIKASEYTREMSGTPILWGDSASNSQIAAIADKLNVKWEGSNVKIGTKAFGSSTHVPAMIQQLPGKDGYTVVLNSGLTFREAHDKTNSLQNPKLPDWAILDISEPPNAERAGKVVAADFFDEHWQVKPDMPPVDSK
jgi:Prolyl oligopeptidase family